MNRKTLFWIIFLLSPLFFLATLEGVGRFYIYIKHGVPGKSYGLWRYDKVLGAQHAENAYNTNGGTNDFGFRNNEDVKEPKPQGSLRFIAYGGSTTFCYNLSNQDTWPAQLQKKMRANRLGGQFDQVLNGGAVMWSLGHAYQRAIKDLPVLKPDYVLIYSGINELSNANFLAVDGTSIDELVAGDQYGVFAKNLNHVSWINRNLVIVKGLRKLLGQLEVVGPSKDTYKFKDGLNPAILKNYLTVLERFVKLIRDNGAKPVFVVQQTNNWESNWYYISFSREGAKLTKKLNVLTIDPTKKFENYAGDKKGLFAGTGVHVTNLGAQILSDYIFDELKRAERWQ